MQAPASRLRLVRTNRGITQIAVAIPSDISPARYSLLERGYVTPTPRERASLAAALQVPESELFTPDGRVIRGMPVHGK